MDHVSFQDAVVREYREDERDDCHTNCQLPVFAHVLDTESRALR